MAFNFGNLGAQVFGGGLLATGQPATPEPLQQRAGSNAMMNVAAALLKAKDTPGASFAGALGNAIMAGQQGYQGALLNAQQRQLLGSRTNAYQTQAKTLADQAARVQDARQVEQGILHRAQSQNLDAFPQAPNTATTQAQPLAIQDMAAPLQRLQDPQWLTQTANLLAKNGQPERAALYLKLAQAQTPKPDMTTLMQNAQAAGFQRGTPEYQRFIQQQLAKPGQTINVNSGASLQPAEAKATAAFGTGIGERVNDRISAAQEALSQNAQLGQIQNAIAQGAKTGLGQDQLLNLKNLAQSVLGIDAGPEVGQQELIQRIGNTMALRLRNPDSGLGLTGNTSNRDLAFLKSSVPGLQRTPQGNAAIIDAMQRINKMKVDAARYQQQIIAQHGGIVPSNLDSLMLDYVNNYQLYSPAELDQLKQTVKKPGPRQNGLEPVAPPESDGLEPGPPPESDGIKFLGFE